jgi:predicted DNA-binding protein
MTWTREFGEALSKTRAFSVGLTDEERELVTTWSRAVGQTQAQFVRTAIREHIEVLAEVCEYLAEEDE